MKTIISIAFLLVATLANAKVFTFDNTLGASFPISGAEIEPIDFRSQNFRDLIQREVIPHILTATMAKNFEVTEFWIQSADYALVARGDGKMVVGAQIHLSIDFIEKETNALGERWGSSSDERVNFVLVSSEWEMSNFSRNAGN